MVLEGFGAERVPVADLDAQPLQESGIDGLRGSRRPGFSRVLGELAGAGRVELFLGANLDLVEPPDTILGPTRRGLSR